MSYGRSGLFAAPSGIAASLKTNKKLSLRAWGTDRDIKDFSAKFLVKSPIAEIKAEGSYFLSPVSLTESVDAPPKEAIKHHLNEAINAAITNEVAGRFSLLIPVNCGDNHWRLAIIRLYEYKITHVVLWDPFSGDEASLARNVSFINLHEACMDVTDSDDVISIGASFGGVQTNSYSCMDYVLQYACQLLKIDNELVFAETATQLRLAIVRQIARNDAYLKLFADDIVVSVDGKNASIDFDSRRDLVDLSLALSQSEQVLFDRFFIEEAQQLYYKEPDLDEKIVQKKAFSAAYYRFGIYQSAPKIDLDASDVVSSERSCQETDELVKNYFLSS